MQITSLATLKKYADGEVVALPPFVGDEPFVVRLKRPSFLGMAQNGKFPNSLLKSAGDLFTKKTVDSQTTDLDDDSLKQISEIMELIISESMLEPTYAQLKEINLELTDAQRMAIFAYSQEGIKALSTFHGNAEILDSVDNVGEIQ